VKICDVTQFYSPFSGGVKRYLHEKIDYIQNETPHEHVLIVPGARSECVSAARSRIYTIRSPIVSRTSQYRLLLDLRKVQDIVESEKPHLIESADPYQIGWRARRIGRALRIPVIAFYHSHFVEAHIRHATRFLGGVVMNLAKRYVRNLYNGYEATLVPSAGLGAELSNWGVRNVQRVSLGINPNIFTPLPDDARVTRAQFGVPGSRTLLLYVGRLSPEKNTLNLFQAFEIVNERMPDQFHLLVVGDGQERKHLQDLQTRCAHTTWLQYCSEPAGLARFYRAADLLVHPGTQETFGLVALESQACGTVVLGVRGSFMDEVIRHDQSWWAEKPTPKALADAIESVSACQLDQLGKSAAAIVREEFSWARIFQRLFYIYQEVCSKYAEKNGSKETASGVHNSPVSQV
jgi:alpha-1,6-mannosyltransferase